MKRSTALHIAAATARERHDSPEHRRFKTLLTKIEAAKQRLADWQSRAPHFAEAYAAKLQPEIDRLHAARRTWALELERIALEPGWSKADARSLAQLVCDHCGALLDSGVLDEAGAAQIKAVYNRFAEVDFDAEGEQHLGAMKSMVESMSGLDLGEEPVESMEDLMRRAQEGLARQRAEGAGGSSPSGSDDAWSPLGAARKPRAKTAAQRRAEEDAKRVSQTAREVYRKLAAALHPDRASPDLSPAQLAERTALMQRANTAYEAGDLLALLALQLQIEQVDVAHAAWVAASQVKHFNKVLAEQLREIEAEIDERQIAFCEGYGIVSDRRMDPNRLDLVLKDEQNQLAATLMQLQHEQRVLRGDATSARRYLKQQRAEQRLEDQMDAMFEDQFDLMMAAASRQRRK